MDIAKDWAEILPESGNMLIKYLILDKHSFDDYNLDTNSNILNYKFWQFADLFLCLNN